MIVIEPTDDEVNKVLNEYKQGINIDFDNGQLRFQSLPIMWSRSELWYHIQTEIEALIGDAGPTIIQRIGKPNGANFYMLSKGYLAQQNSEITDEELMKYLCAENYAIGWGKMRIEKEENKIVVVSETGFPVGQAYKVRQRKSSNSADSYFLGYLEGFFSAMDRVNYKGQEIECLAKGDSCCKFIFEVSSNGGSV